MKVGFLTGCLKDGLEEILSWAQDNNFNAVELGGMQAGYIKKDFAEDILEIFGKYKIEISALGSFRNYLEGNEKTRENNFNLLKESIDTAEALKIPCVTSFVGLNNQLDYQGNLELFKKEWIPVIEYAREKKVKIAIENCPSKSEFALTGGNLMFTPGIMGELFQITPDNFGLNLDPSHLLWQMVDIPIVVEEFEGRIFHTHAKDTEINRTFRDFEGVFGKNTYTFRIPGNGEIDWEKYISALKSINYDGVLSIELEDPLYYGSDKKAKEGLIMSRDYLRKFL